jgi:uncharacterized protein
MFHQRLALRRLKALLIVAGLAGMGVGLLGAHIVSAQELAPEFTGFQRPAPPAARSMVAADEWERINRPADRMGPRPLRPVDRQLLDAARAADWPLVLELLTKQRADPDAMGPRGTHVLVLAARRGEIEVVRELLRRGAVIDRRGDDGNTALGAAAFYGHPHLVAQLMQAGADPAQTSITGQTPMHLAALAGHNAVLQRLLRLGVPVDLLNTRRETALDVAAQNGQVAVMDHLMAAGADMTRAGGR